MILARRPAPAGRFTAALFAGALALAGSAVGAQPHLLSLPPSIDTGRAHDLTGALTELLAQAVGEPFTVAEHASSLDYLDNLSADRFAVVVEGPHVLGALARRGTLVPVAEFKQPLSFVVVVSARDNGIYQLADLAGKPLCAGEIPDLFALSLLSGIDNPAREPVMVPAGDAPDRVRRLLGGRCRAATLQLDRYLTLQPRDGADDLRIIFKSREMPGFGVGVSAAIAVPVRESIVAALLSGEGRGATRALGVALFGSEAPLAAGDPDRLRTMASLMDPYFYE